MGLYTAFRSNGGPTFYGPSKTPYEADLIESGLIFCFVIIAFSFFLVLPGIRGKEKIFTFIRITVSLFIGAGILLSNYAMSWEESEIETETKYKAGTGRDIHATVGLHIGLRGVNITLKGEPEQQLNETINYNEHFSWEWRQGRLGFGPFAGRYSQEYRAAQFRGLPLPILWVAEYFTFDGEGIRWGRFYRQSGWYTHILLWTAFPLWVLANILFFVLLRYGAYMLMLCGLCMVSGNILWATLRNFNELVIPFTRDAKMEFHFGGAYFLCLITGILCLILGIVVFIMDLRFPSAIATFFNVDVLQDSEEIQVEEIPQVEENNEQEEEDDQEVDTRTNGGSSAPRPETTTEDDIYDVRINLPPPKMRSERTFTQRFQKNRRKTKQRPPPPPPPQDNSSDEETYENAEAVSSYARQAKRAAHTRQVEIEMR